MHTWSNLASNNTFHSVTSASLKSQHYDVLMVGLYYKHFLRRQCHTCLEPCPAYRITDTNHWYRFIVSLFDWQATAYIVTFYCSSLDTPNRFCNKEYNIGADCLASLTISFQSNDRSTVSSFLFKIEPALSEHTQSNSWLIFLQWSVLQKLITIPFCHYHF